MLATQSQSRVHLATYRRAVSVILALSRGRDDYFINLLGFAGLLSTDFTDIFKYHSKGSVQKIHVFNTASGNLDTFYKLEKYQGKIFVKIISWPEMQGLFDLPTLM